MTAIPLVFSHVLFKAWVHKFEIKMRRAAQKLLVLVQAMKPGAAAATGPPRTATPRPPPTVGSPRAAEDELRHG
jgi:biopolymer transport protein ExbB